MVVIAFLVIFVTDTFVEQFVFEDWIAAKTNATNRQTIKAIKRALGLQPYLHLLFVGGLIVYVLGFSRSATSIKSTEEAWVGIQENTETYIARNHRPPFSIEELIVDEPSTSRWYDALDRQPTRFETLEKNRYRILFAGDDGELGTPDDFVILSDVKLKKCYRTITNTAWIEVIEPVLVEVMRSCRRPISSASVGW